MKFKAMQLIIDDHEPNLKDLKDIESKGKKFETEHNNNWYKIESHMVSDKYLWIYVQYDNSKLYNDTIYDGRDEQERKNPRRKSEVELRKQFFACYNLTNKRLYLSCYDKKSFLEYYIRDALQKTTYIKNIYKSLDEFINSIKILNSVKFTQKDNLYNRSNNSMFTRQADIFGFGMPEKLKVKIDYDLNLTTLIKKQLQNLKYRYDNEEFEELVVIGKDDKNIEKAYDFSTLLESLEIDAKKDDNDRYDNDEILFLFLQEMRNKYGKES